MTVITQKLVQELLDYDPITGVFCWRSMRQGGAVGEAGSVDRKGYRIIGIAGHKHVAAHRLAWLYVYGRWPSKPLDHINGVTDDNRIANLREATVVQNGQNLRKKKNNTSGYAGVRRYLDYDLWQARITVNRKEIHLGYRKTPEEAYRLYLSGKEKYHTYQPKPRTEAAA